MSGVRSPGAKSSVFATTESFSFRPLKSNVTPGIQHKKQQNVKSGFFTEIIGFFYVLLFFALNPERNVAFKWAKTETSSCRKNDTIAFQKTNVQRSLP